MAPAALCRGVGGAPPRRRPRAPAPATGAANVADLPFVGRVIRNVVSDVVSDLLVLPNMMTVKLAQDAPGVGDIFSRSYIEPWVVKLTMAEVCAASHGPCPPPPPQNDSGMAAPRCPRAAGVC